MSDEVKADGEESEYQYCAGDPVLLVVPSGDGALRVDLPISKSDHRRSWTNYLIAALKRNAGHIQDMFWNNVESRIGGPLGCLEGGSRYVQMVAPRRDIPL